MERRFESSRRVRKVRAHLRGLRVDRDAKRARLRSKFRETVRTVREQGQERGAGGAENPHGRSRAFRRLFNRRNSARDFLELTFRREGGDFLDVESQDRKRLLRAGGSVLRRDKLRSETPHGAFNIGDGRAGDFSGVRELGEGGRRESGPQGHLVELVSDSA